MKSNIIKCYRPHLSNKSSTQRYINIFADCAVVHLSYLQPQWRLKMDYDQSHSLTSKVGYMQSSVAYISTMIAKWVGVIWALLRWAWCSVCLCVKATLPPISAGRTPAHRLPTVGVRELDGLACGVLFTSSMAEVQTEHVWCAGFQHSITFLSLGPIAPFRSWGKYVLN